jgi:flagellar basal body rod protein FlgG
MDLLKGEKMKTLKLGVCFLDEEDNIISKRMIGTNWSVNVEQDMRENFNVNMMDEVSAILTENLKLQLTEDTIRNMLDEVQEKSQP